MIEIRRFIPSVERAGIESLMVAHSQEVEANMQMTPNPQWEMYESLESLDMVVAHAAYDAGVMVGYVILFVMPHIHYGFLYGQHDVLYVKPEYRASSAGLKLIRLAEKDAQERGAQRIYWHAKPMSAFAGVMQKTKHPLEEEIYMKEF